MALPIANGFEKVGPVAVRSGTVFVDALPYVVEGMAFVYASADSLDLFRLQIHLAESVQPSAVFKPTPPQPAFPATIPRQQPFSL